MASPPASPSKGRRLPSPWNEIFYLGREVDRRGRRGVVLPYSHLKMGHQHGEREELGERLGVPLQRTYVVEWSDGSKEELPQQDVARIATNRFVDQPWVSDIVLYLQKNNWSKGTCELGMAELRERAAEEASAAEKARKAAAAKAKRDAKKADGAAGSGAGRKRTATAVAARKAAAPAAKKARGGGGAAAAAGAGPKGKKEAAPLRSFKISNLEEQLAAAAEAKRRARSASGAAAAGTPGRSTAAAAAARLAPSPAAGDAAAAVGAVDQGASNSLGRAAARSGQATVASPRSSSRGGQATVSAAAKRAAAAAAAVAAPAKPKPATAAVRRASGSKRQRQAAAAAAASPPQAPSKANTATPAKPAAAAAAHKQAAGASPRVGANVPAEPHEDRVEEAELDLSARPARLGGEFATVEGEVPGLGTARFFQVGGSSEQQQASPGAVGQRLDELPAKAEPLWRERCYTHTWLGERLLYKYNLQLGPDGKWWRIYSKDVMVRDEHSFTGGDFLCRQWKIVPQPDENYDVERVVCERYHPEQKVTQYLIKWGGYELDLDDDNWVEASGLGGASAKLREWRKELRPGFKAAAEFFTGAD